MYKFFLKDNGPGPDIIITRALLALAGFAAFMVRNSEHSYLNIFAALFLLLLAAFTKQLLVGYKINRLILLIVSSLVLFVATGLISFGVILLLYGILFKFIYKKPWIEVSVGGIKVRKTLSSVIYPWDQFNNVILKDSLLTLDFITNKLLQLTIEDNDSIINEGTFNKFCNGLILPAKDIQ